MKTVIDEKEFNQHREFWADIAKKRGWYVEPFFIQVWTDETGKIQDSVSFRGIDKNYVIKA